MEYESANDTTQYDSTALVYPHCKPYIRTLFIFTFNLKLILYQGEECVKNIQLYTKNS